MTENRNRHIELAGSSNLRDIGGYPGAGGRLVRWGQVYRSGALGRLGPDDWAWMIDHDIAAVCDLRSAEERELAPTRWQGRAHTRAIGVAYEAELVFGPLARARRPDAHVGEMSYSLYEQFPQFLAPSFRMMFEALLDGHVPLIVHCSAGQDRTGIAIALVLSVLGVPRETIYQDYLLSTAARRVANELDHTGLAGHAATNSVARFYTDMLARRGVEVLVPRSLFKPDGQPILADAFAFIDRQWGSPGNFVAEVLEVNADAQARLRDMYLEPA